MLTSTELLQGTLDLLILQTLATGSMHGWGAAQRIQRDPGSVLRDRGRGHCIRPCTDWNTGMDTC